MVLRGVDNFKREGVCCSLEGCDGVTRGDKVDVATVRKVKLASRGGITYISQGERLLQS